MSCTTRIALAALGAALTGLSCGGSGSDPNVFLGPPDAAVDGGRADGGEAGLKLTMSLARDPATSPSPILVTVRAARDGVPAPGLPVEILAGGVNVQIRDEADGRYTATVVPSAPSGEIALVGRIPGEPGAARKTAIVLPGVDPAWGQPEKVDGLVNTAGYEDLPAPSPDGEWLVVGLYSPIDLGCCLEGCGGAQPFDPAAAACNVVQGPTAAPMRPDLPGAERVLSPTSIRQECPQMCMTGSLWSRVAMPLYAAYGFKRQPDGSFAEPFLVGFDAGGCSSFSGLHFAGAPRGNQGEVVFVFSHETLGTQLFYSPIALGQKNLLGAYQCVSGQAVGSGFVPTHLSVDLGTAEPGSVSFGAGHLWFDDRSTRPRQAMWSAVTGALPQASFSVPDQVRPSAQVQERALPSIDPDGSRLTFGRDQKVRSIEYKGGDPGTSGAWGPEREELAGEGAAGETRNGAIPYVGAGSVARPAGRPAELYFSYMLIVPTGRDVNIARVEAR